MTQSAFPVDKIRSFFPQVEKKMGNYPLTYLDNAASTLKCAPVIEAIHQHYSQEAANIHRGVHALSEEGTRKYEETRDAVQHFLNAQKRHEILFTKGTTESLNLVAESFGRTFLKPGDEILLSTMEHHSNIVPWQLIAERTGAKIVEIPLTENLRIDVEAYEKRLSSGNVKIVSMAYVSNTLGVVNPIKECIQKAHEAGAFFVVDAAQSTAHLPLEEQDVQDLDCDFLALSAHKCYGPTGVGILYGKEKWLEQMPPYQGGGDMIDHVTLEKTTYNELPHKFEAGTPHIAGVIAFKKALDFLRDVGLEEIHHYEYTLLKYATQQLEEIPKLRIFGPRPEHDDVKSAVISFEIEGAHPHDLGTLLDQQGIAVRTGHHCTQPLMTHMGVKSTTRASFALYNNFEEVDRLYYGLIKACELL